MTEVILHVYDVTNSGSEKTNNTILNINKIFKDAIGLGGIFHSAVQIHGDDEWSFGFCEQGTGVFSCPSTKNPMYTYREQIVLGKTSFSISKVNQILRELSREWPGNAYDLLAKNCNHFCDEFCVRLGVSKLPGWVNRFANAGDAAMEVAGTTAFRFRQAKTEIVSASKVAYRFLASVTSNNGSALESPENSNRGVPRFQGTWFKNLIANGVKPSSSTEVDNQDENMLLQHQRSMQGAGQLSRQISQQESDKQGAGQLSRQISQQESDKQGAGQLSRQISQQESDLPPLHQNSRHDEALPASSTF
ncbi:desumoylating isopeptidase [Salix suchowensis]|uniref:DESUMOYLATING ISOPEPTIDASE n=1 Tax=Salix koriyanagi TaxID=2511006 RepID=A0A9Q0ZL51_9ROSI|nr:desumoylating isopeptidase [Salix suchowensis]KAJ6738478.1 DESUMOYLATING ISOPEPTIDASE [Salix koriyanagi]